MILMCRSGATAAAAIGVAAHHPAASFCEDAPHFSSLLADVSHSTGARP